jgi:hypothetical protein
MPVAKNQQAAPTETLAPTFVFSAMPNLARSAAHLIGLATTIWRQGGSPLGSAMAHR